MTEEWVLLYRQQTTAEKHTSSLTSQKERKGGLNKDTTKEKAIKEQSNKEKSKQERRKESKKEKWKKEQESKKGRKKEKESKKGRKQAIKKKNERKKTYAHDCKATIPHPILTYFLSITHLRWIFWLNAIPSQLQNYVTDSRVTSTNK